MSRRKNRRRASYGGVPENIALGGVALLAAAGAAYFFVLPQIREANLLKYAADARVGETPNGRYVMVPSMKLATNVKTGMALSEKNPADLAELVYLMKKYNVDLD